MITKQPATAKRENSERGTAAALSLALAALLGGPGLFYLQSSWKNSPDDPIEPVYSEEEAARMEFARLGDDAMDGKPAGIAQLAACLIRQGDRVSAESWLQYGAIQLKVPSLMLMYGDFLRDGKGRSALRLADFWYARAEAAARKGADGTAGLEQFRQAVRERRRSVRTELEK